MCILHDTTKTNQENMSMSHEIELSLGIAKRPTQRNRHIWQGSEKGYPHERESEHCLHHGRELHQTYVSIS